MQRSGDIDPHRTDQGVPAQAGPDSFCQLVIRQVVKGVADIVENRQPPVFPQRPFELGTRITSYNVCYTKLLRRLNVINLHLPPLRERKEDIPLLVNRFIGEQNAKFGTEVKGLTPEALTAVRNYPWPGNIRQLRNVIEAALTLTADAYIGLPVIAQFIEVEGDFVPVSEADYASALAHFETEYLNRLLRKHGSNVEAAAAEAGMNMATIYRKLKKHQIDKTRLG